MLSRAATAAIFVVMVLCAAACSSSVSSVTADGERLVAPQPTLVPPTLVPQTLPVPTVEAVFEPTTPPVAVDPTSPPEPTATATPEPTPQPEGPCNAGPLAIPDPDRPRYEGVVTIDPLAGTVAGSISIDYQLDQDVDELYVRLWPNGPRPASGGVNMELGPVFDASGPLNVEMVDPTTARIDLAETLVAGERSQVDVNFTLVVPVELKSRLSGRDDYMRLGTILPLMPWEPGRGWALDPATSLFAEAVSSPVADYSIEINVPDSYNVLASGIDDGTGLWQVEAARDFAISVGRFRTVTGTAMAPGPVQITVGVHETVNDDPNVYLVKVIDSLEQFSGRWGQYPWPSLTFAITPNLSGGIEFPTHIMQGPDTQGRVTSHEVGHMFFYSLVGNNQGSAPWLDEGITSYAEFTYEGVGPGAYAIPSAGVGNATQPMTFWEGRSDIYYRSVYSQTGFALQQLGSQVDVDCALAQYVAANAHSIATAEDFIAAFEPTFPDVVAQLAAFGVDLGQ